MRYLKHEINDGYYEYFPLESCKLTFLEVDDNEYRVCLQFGTYEFTLHEKVVINDIQKVMIRLANLPDGEVICSIFDTYITDGYKW